MTPDDSTNNINNPNAGTQTNSPAKQYREATSPSGAGQASVFPPHAPQPSGPNAATAPTSGTAREHIDAELSKMTSGGDELRDHDFPVPNEPQKAASRPVGLDKGQQAVGQHRSGGEHGTVKGDKEEEGVVPTIMDQDMTTPDFAQQTG